MMDCGEARRLIWLTDSPRELTSSLQQAQEHVAACPACQGFERDMRRLASQIRDHAPQENAPREVRDRLFGLIAAARAASDQRNRRVRWQGILVASALLLAIGLATAEWRAHRDSLTGPLSALVEDHMRAIGQDEVASADSAVISEWLRARLPFGVQVPSLPGLQLRGARLCLMDGRRGAVLEYSTMAGESVSYYVVPASERSSTNAEGALTRASRAGYHVVGWREPGLLHAFVAALPESWLVELARRCIREMRA